MKRAKWLMNPQLFNFRRRIQLYLICRLPQLRNLSTLKLLFTKGKVSFNLWNRYLFRKQRANLMVFLTKKIYLWQMYWRVLSVRLTITPLSRSKSQLKRKRSSRKSRQLKRNRSKYVLMTLLTLLLKKKWIVAQTHKINLSVLKSTILKLFNKCLLQE